jgi:superfamily II DNA or RNA helicase
MDIRLISDHLVLEHPNPAQLMAVFPQAKVAPVGNTFYGAVAHTLENAQILNNMGYPVQSPIRTQYDWPGDKKPFPHQIETAELCTLNKRAFILNKMRTGKTLSVLWAADYLKKLGLIRRVLILAPLSTLTDVWANELFFSFHKRTHAVVYGDAAKRKALMKKDHDFYILNHDGIKTVEDALKQRQDIDLIIIDELSDGFRNRHDRWKMMKKLVRPNQWIWGLTGTPTPNSPVDAYAQMKLVKPENYAGSFTDFKNLIMMPLGPFKWVPRQFVNTVINGVHCRTGDEVVNQILKPSIAIPRSVCSAREPIITTRYAELSPTQKKHYEDLRKECVTLIGDTQVTAVNAAVLAQKLIMVSAGVVYAADKERVEIDFGPRLSLVQELIEQNEEKVLVFVPFTGVLDAVARELRKRWTVEVVDGGVSKTKRDKIFYEFRNNKAPHVIVAHPQCMSHGLDLTAASMIIWYAPFYNNEIYQQANARLDGVKQTKEVDIVRVYGTKLEQDVYAVLDGKESIQQAILDLARGK